MAFILVHDVSDFHIDSRRSRFRCMSIYSTGQMPNPPQSQPGGGDSVGIVNRLDLFNGYSTFEHLVAVAKRSRSSHISRLVRAIAASDGLLEVRDDQSIR